MASLSYSTVISAHLAAVDVQLAAAAVGDGEGAVGAQRQPSLVARHPRRIPLPAQIHVHLRIASPNLGGQTYVQQTPGNGCLRGIVLRLYTLKVTYAFHQEQVRL